MMGEGMENTAMVFEYVKLRVTQNFHETWYDIYLQSTTIMIPTLLVVSFLHRVISFASMEQKELLYDFKPIIERIKESNANIDMQERYDVLHDKDNVSVIVSEVVSKGLVPVEY